MWAAPDDNTTTPPETCWRNKTLFQIGLILILIIAVPFFLIMLIVYIVSATGNNSAKCSDLCDVFADWRVDAKSNEFTDYPNNFPELVFPDNTNTTKNEIKNNNTVPVKNAEIPKKTDKKDEIKNNNAEPVKDTVKKDENKNNNANPPQKTETEKEKTNNNNAVPPQKTEQKENTKNNNAVPPEKTVQKDNINNNNVVKNTVEKDDPKKPKTAIDDMKINNKRSIPFDINMAQIAALQEDLYHDSQTEQILKCPAIILSPYLVLTVNECLSKNVSSMSVRIGSKLWSTTGSLRKIKNIETYGKLTALHVDKSQKKIFHGTVKFSKNFQTLNAKIFFWDSDLSRPLKMRKKFGSLNRINIKIDDIKNKFCYDGPYIPRFGQIGAPLVDKFGYLIGFQTSCSCKKNQKQFDYVPVDTYSSWIEEQIKLYSQH